VKSEARRRPGGPVAGRWRAYPRRTGG